MSEHRDPASARHGYGQPHPDLVTLLDGLTPAAVERVAWGSSMLDVTAYPTPTRLPPELVTSVRCIVRVNDRIVLCRAPDTLHVWPGGRRLPGETYPDTVRREVHEETGWLIEQPHLVPLGFLHMRHTQPQPASHPYPHPDFLQLVYTAPARKRDHTQSDHWSDLDGWEQDHRLVTRQEIAALDLSPAQHAFLEILPDHVAR